MSETMDHARHEWIGRVLGVFPTQGVPTPSQNEDDRLIEEELNNSLKTLEKIRGKDAYGKNEKGSLAEIRTKVDDLRMAWPDLEDRAYRAPTKDGTTSLQNIGKIIEELWNKAHDAPFVDGNPDDEESMRGLVIFDTKILDGLRVQALKKLAGRRTGDRTGYVDQDDKVEGWNESTGKHEFRARSEWVELRKADVRTGDLTGKKEGELVEGWNATTKANEYHHPDEWEHIKLREGVGLGKENKMDKLNQGGVHVQPHKGTDKMPVLPVFERLLRQERDTTAGMREKLTEQVNSRKGGAQEDLQNNCKMAQGLTSLLKGNPDLLKEGGLFGRIVGDLPGQGQHNIDKQNPDPEVVITTITDASKRLAAGKGEGEDANKVLQFIGCFVDGLTEVNEKKQPATGQFDKIWPVLQKALNLKDDDREKLMKRVEGFKEIANGVADTGMGKGKRKNYTRTSDMHPEASMPDSPEWQIHDEDALIKNDISGSMHSCLLAQELSESLVGGKGIKSLGDPVKVVDKVKLNARVVDALALTAGGRKPKIEDGKPVMKGGKPVYTEVVLHTAYEMINGMRAITGMPEIDQMTATQIMILLGRGKTFTQAVETMFPPGKLPWPEEKTVKSELPRN